jgi:hypothetical protein
MGDSLMIMSVLTTHQEKTLGPVRVTQAHWPKAHAVCVICFDDRYKNGHNTLRIGTEVYPDRDRAVRRGQIYDCLSSKETLRYFPEVKDLLPFNGCGTDGPIHYIANTRWHAGDTDCWGGRAGEVRRYRHDVAVNGRRLHPDRKPHELYKIEEAASVAGKIGNVGVVEIVDVPWIMYEGHEPDLEAARRCALWPDATLEQLRSKEALEARLPKLLEEFRKAVTDFGFTY